MASLKPSHYSTNGVINSEYKLYQPSNCRYCCCCHQCNSNQIHQQQMGKHQYTTNHLNLDHYIEEQNRVDSVAQQDRIPTKNYISTPIKSILESRKMYETPFRTASSYLKDKHLSTKFEQETAHIMPEIRNEKSKQKKQNQQILFTTAKDCACHCQLCRKASSYLTARKSYDFDEQFEEIKKLKDRMETSKNNRQLKYFDKKQRTLTSPNDQQKNKRQRTELLTRIDFNDHEYATNSKIHHRQNSPPKQSSLEVRDYPNRHATRCIDNYIQDKIDQTKGTSKDSRTKSKESIVVQYINQTSKKQKNRSYFKDELTQPTQKTVLANRVFGSTHRNCQYCIKSISKSPPKKKSPSKTFHSISRSKSKSQNNNTIKKTKEIVKKPIFMRIQEERKVKKAPTINLYDKYKKDNDNKLKRLNLSFSSLTKDQDTKQAKLTKRYLQKYERLKEGFNINNSRGYDTQRYSRLQSQISPEQTQFVRKKLMNFTDHYLRGSRTGKQKVNREGQYYQTIVQSSRTEEVNRWYDLNKKDIHEQLMRIYAYELVERYLSAEDVVKMLTEYFRASIDPKRWSLLIYDQVYHKVKDRYSFRAN